MKQEDIPANCRACGNPIPVGFFRTGYVCSCGTVFTDSDFYPLPSKPETVHHPSHYGDENDPYEAIRVIEAWALGFNLGNTVKYIRRAPYKGSRVEDLKKARWYLDREIENLEGK